MRRTRVSLSGIRVKKDVSSYRRLMTSGCSIADKYREGKLQSTLKRELKEPKSSRGK